MNAPTKIPLDVEPQPASGKGRPRWYSGAMCVNYLPPRRQQLREHFGVVLPDDDWPDECWQDHAAPILLPDDAGGVQVRVANYGFIPRRHQRDGMRLTTLNARDELAKLRGAQPRFSNQAWKRTGRRGAGESIGPPI